MKIAQVKIKNGKYGDSETLYSFKAADDVQVNNLVVCDTTYGLVLGEVKSLTVDIANAKKATKWIVQVIDMDAHDARVVAEARKEGIMAQLQARRKKIEDERFWDMLAKEDEVIKDLLAQYKDIKVE